METIRAFIAVDLGDALRVSLAELQQRLKQVGADVRWVKPEAIHLTLAFIGEIAIEKIIPLKSELDRAFRAFDAFPLTAKGTGFFGRPGKPGVIWAGIADCPPLMELQRKTIMTLQQTNVRASNKPFRPHITLGRIKAPGYTAVLLDKIEAFKQEPLGRTRIDAVDLFQSRLTPAGAEHTVLHRVPLRLRDCGNP